MGDVIKLALHVKLDQYAAKQWDGIHVVRVFILDPLQDFITLIKVVLVKILLRLNEPNIE